MQLPGTFSPMQDNHPEPGGMSADAVRALQRVLREQGPAADPLAVVRAHVAAVHCGDPQLMAADYAPGACITRGSVVVDPWSYFPTVVQRLGASRLVVESLELAAPDPVGAMKRIVTMRWRLDGGQAHGSCGTDTLHVQGDRIVAQHVQLHTADF